MSASPMLISWRRNSSVNRFSSVKFKLPESCLPLSDRRGVIQTKSCAAGTNKTGKAPWLEGTADRRSEERYSGRTFLSECFPYICGDRVQPLARRLRDCLRRGLSLCPAGVHKPESCDWRGKEIQSIRSQTPDWHAEFR